MNYATHYFIGPLKRHFNFIIKNLKNSTEIRMLQKVIMNRLLSI